MKITDTFYTLVNHKGEPVYTELGMDGHFVVADTPHSLMVCSKNIGWSQFKSMCEWGRYDDKPLRMAEVKVSIVPIE